MIIPGLIRLYRENLKWEDTDSLWDIALNSVYTPVQQYVALEILNATYEPQDIDLMRSFADLFEEVARSAFRRRHFWLYAYANRIAEEKFALAEEWEREEVPTRYLVNSPYYPRFISR